MSVNNGRDGDGTGGWERKGTGRLANRGTGWCVARSHVMRPPHFYEYTIPYRHMGWVVAWELGGDLTVISRCG